MARKRQFDEGEVLGIAMRAFWRYGYAGTSIDDLVRGTGVNRASLYATFGDKRSLFVRALGSYDRGYRQAWFAALALEHGPRDAILRVFQAAVEAGSCVSGDGCFLVNTAMELAPHDPEMAAICNAAFDQTRLWFRHRVRAGQTLGELDPAADAEQIGASLLGLFLGMRVLSRSTTPPETLEAIARQARALVPAWTP